MSFNVYQLGTMDYDKAYHLQKILLHLRMRTEINNTLLLLEHPPTITIGRFGKFNNILASQKQLNESGISLFFTDRGGDVTYHGPGQLVGYPIINLRQSGINIRQYITNLEEVIIRFLGSFSIATHRYKDHAGVCVEGKSIAAIGLCVKKWVSMHGFSININTDLNSFSLIKPCGFSDMKVTSVSQILGCHIPFDNIIEKIMVCFSEVFNTNMELKKDQTL